MRHLVRVLSIAAALVLTLTSLSTGEAQSPEDSLPCAKALGTSTTADVMLSTMSLADDPPCCIDSSEVVLKLDDLPDNRYTLEESVSGGQFTRTFRQWQPQSAQYPRSFRMMVWPVESRNVAASALAQTKDSLVRATWAVMPDQANVGDESFLLTGIGNQVRLFFRRGTYVLELSEGFLVKGQEVAALPDIIRRARVMCDRLDAELAKQVAASRVSVPGPGPCAYTLGFKALHDQIPDTVGTCLEDERFNVANGNAEQRTSGGLLVWRKADNWTAFTNGSMTWINGPQGLVSRPNSGPLFAFEAGGSVASPPAPSSTPGVNISSALLPAWNIIIGLSKVGPYFKEAVPLTEVKVEVQSLPAGTNGAYSPGSNTIGISQAIMGESPLAIAGVLAHELTHAMQHGADPQGVRDCVPLEVQAFMFQAAVWYEANNGYGPSRTQLERHNNTIAGIVFTEGEPGMYTAVVNTPDYQEECRLFVPR